MGRYRLKRGLFGTLDRKILRAGDVIETDRDMAKLYPGRFEAVVVNIEPSPVRKKKLKKVTPKEEQSRDKNEEQKETETPQPAAVPKGKDVTAKFPAAVEEDFKVYQLNNRYFVYDTDDLSRPLNEVGLGVKVVEKYIHEKLAD